MKTTKHNITSYLNILFNYQLKNIYLQAKNSGIKYTHDNVVVFLMLTQYQRLHQ